MHKFRKLIVWQKAVGIEVAIRLGYGDMKENQNLIPEVDELGAMLTGFIKSLKADS